jgi:phosphoribosylamine-glycine ligase
MTSRGYPGSFNKGNKISIKGNPLVFVAGAVNKNNEMYTNGGRVLSVVAIENSLKQAHSKVYKEIDNVHFEGAHYRKDIGLN